MRRRGGHDAPIRPKSKKEQVIDQLTSKLAKQIITTLRQVNIQVTKIARGSLTQSIYNEEGRFYIEMLDKAGIRIRNVKLREAIKDKYEEREEPKKKVRHKLPPAIQIAVWERDEGRCVSCGNTEELEFDHIIPLSKGGANTIANIQILCSKCNKCKGAKIGVA